MAKFLGEKKLNIKTKYDNYSKLEWAMLWIEMYSGIDGSHHKDWLIDQIARILKGAKVVVRIATWDDGKKEERFALENLPKSYYRWVDDMKDGEDGKNTYSYDFGVAP